MQVRKRIRLTVELLEARLVPATIIFDGANLYVSDPRIIAGASAVNVTQGTGDAFTVTDGGVSHGTYAVSGGVKVVTKNAPATVGVALTATGLTGNLNVATGSGSSTVTVDGTNAGPGRLTGNTAITLGRAGGAVNLGTVNGLNDAGLVTVQNQGSGPAALVTGNATNASTFSGNVFAGNVTSVTLGNATKGDTFAGNVVVRDTNAPQNTTFALNVGSKILGDAVILGGMGTNAVSINGNVGGNVAVTVPGSANTLTLAGGGSAITIGGSLAYNAGDGTTTFIANGGNTAAVQGNVALNWGNGIGNSLGSTAGFTVGGNFSIANGSNGFDGGTSTTPGVFTANSFQAAVTGTLTLNLGNGPNTFVFDGTNGAVSGGPLTYIGGNGGNTVAVTNAPPGPAHLVNVNVSLGASNTDVFWLGEADGITPPTAGTVVGAVDFGPPSAASTFAPTTPFTPVDNYLMDANYATPAFIVFTNIPS